MTCFPNQVGTSNLGVPKRRCNSKSSRLQLKHTSKPAYPKTFKLRAVSKHTDALGFEPKRSKETNFTFSKVQKTHVKPLNTRTSPPLALERVVDQNTSTSKEDPKAGPSTFDGKDRQRPGKKPGKSWQGRKKPWKNYRKGQKRKKKPARPQGIAHIHSTFNNTIVTVTSLNAHVLSSSSSGRCGFKGSRKSTPYAAQRAAEVAGKKAVLRHLKYIKVHVNGPGLGREKALRGLCKAGLKILLVRDLTRLPYNGCRPAKKRRI